MEKKRITIIGFGWASAGFINTIDNDKYDITIISKNTDFTYTPLLAHNSVYDINVQQNVLKICENVTVIQNNVDEINFDDNKIIINNNLNIDKNIDYLIFSHGSDVNTFNIKGVDENTLFLKTYEDSMKIQKKIRKLKDNTKIAVIGCGPTGTELIGNLIDLNKHTILAIDGLKAPLNMYSSEIGEYTMNIWKDFDVQLYFNNFVKKIDKNNIYFAKDKINYDMAIWCGGIKSNTLTNNVNKILQNNCRYGIPVTNTLNVKYNNKNSFLTNVFAMGDCAYSKNPPTAQVAYQQGTYLAEKFNNNFKTEQPFIFKSKGKICYIGDKKSVYESNYFTLKGRMAFYLNKFTHIYNGININQKQTFVNKLLFGDFN